MAKLFRVIETVMIECLVEAEDEQEARNLAMQTLPDYKHWELTGSHGVDVFPYGPDYNELAEW